MVFPGIQRYVLRDQDLGVTMRACSPSVGVESHVRVSGSCALAFLVSVACDALPGRRRAHAALTGLEARTRNLLPARGAPSMRLGGSL